MAISGGDLLSPVLTPGVPVTCSFSQGGFLENAVLVGIVKRKRWTHWLLCPDSVDGRARARPAGHEAIWWDTKFLENHYREGFPTFLSSHSRPCGRQRPRLSPAPPRHITKWYLIEPAESQKFTFQVRGAVPAIIYTPTDFCCSQPWPKGCFCSGSW